MSESNGGNHIRGMGIVLAAILLLVLPGILSNNLNASGLIVNQSLDCSNATPGIPTCQGMVPVGCQAQSNQCNLQGASVSILNQKSPFTQLFQGNIMGFFTGLTNPQQGIEGGQGPFNALGGLFYGADCQVTKNIDGHQINAAIGHCTQTNTDNSNMTQSQVAKWSNWNQNYSSFSGKLQFYQLGNATFPMNCNWIDQINYTVIAGGPGWTYFGCDVSQGSLIITHPVWSILVAMPVSGGGIAAGTHHWNLFVQLEDASFNGVSAVTSPFHSLKFQTFQDSFKGILVSGNSFSQQYFVPGFNGPVLGFLFGFVLLIIGLGLNFSINGTFFGTGGGFGAGVNEQGTRLAQIMGAGLIVWTPMYSEFSNWFANGSLPNGTDGVIGLFLTALFFVGVVWTAMSWGT